MIESRHIYYRLLVAVLMLLPALAGVAQVDAIARPGQKLQSLGKICLIRAAPGGGIDDQQHFFVYDASPQGNGYGKQWQV